MKRLQDELYEDSLKEMERKRKEKEEEQKLIK